MPRGPAKALVDDPRRHHLIIQDAGRNVGAGSISRIGCMLDSGGDVVLRGIGLRAIEFN